MVADTAFVKAIFAGRQRGEKMHAERVTIRPVTVRGEMMRQISQFDGRKDISQNIPLNALAQAMAAVFSARFTNSRIETGTRAIDARLTKSGDVLVGETTSTSAAPAAAHNRVKHLPLQEGKADVVLEAMGIVDRQGRVRPTMRDKFVQVNEFIKLLEHVLDDAKLAVDDRPLRLLDCGSGAAYLTIAVHHWLNDIKGRRTEVVGVDVNDEVVRASMAKGARLPTAPTFLSGKIGALEGVAADIVVALHACDTATDDAIMQGVRSGARVILVAPCCHKELYGQLRSEALAGMLRHGIIRQRLAEQVTDTLRAAALKACGYRAEIVEFVSLEHTGRNLMIRAVKVRDSGDRAEFDAIKTFWGVEPTIGRLLGGRPGQPDSEDGAGLGK